MLFVALAKSFLVFSGFVCHGTCSVMEAGSLHWSGERRNFSLLRSQITDLTSPTNTRKQSESRCHGLKNPYGITSYPAASD